MSPGWYPDPNSPGWLRFWDGKAWTNHTSPDPAAAAWSAMNEPDPRRDLDSELRFARYGRIAAYSLAGIYFVQYIAIAIIGGKIAHAFRAAIDEANQNPNANGNVFADRLKPIQGEFSILNAVGFLQLVAVIVFLVWLYNAATFAHRAGVPAHRGPIWALVGYFVPVVNVWFPYQSAADLFERDDPRRRIAGWWWALWLIDGALIIPIVIVSIFSTTAAIVVAIVAAIGPFFGARLGVALIAASGEAHQARLAARPSGH